jgi:hypothetical protein
MPMPELPVNVDDPTHDTQRDGERQDTAFYASHRGKGRHNAPAADKAPDGALRYEE